ncbi:pseudouridine synthase [Thiomicrorhabdus heinhorstiae]|uniref:tRNA pseudouridine synthase C n=1 Tax=Thiomicrorhabdus heinhorstiae TaxID=2748010 RepID=A0ABS0BYG6_9GAMM|nr:pseudouridine synthase [Thiomicrorhabdus heinhorstiae]MBF6058133.1 pseudouridylate synthase [Thiomicrorhabdus heinhorstiae]
MQTQCQLDALQLIYQDESIVAIHKPAGLLVHRSPIDKHETQFAVQMTRDLIGQAVFPAHRLDKATSGLLLFALDSDSARDLGRQFSDHTLRKTYLALCRGWTQEYGMINKPLLYKKDKYGDRNKQEPSEPQAALTEYNTLAQGSLNIPLGKFPQQRYSLLQLQPQTGRKHQIRRHLNGISHPIIGDVSYGDRHHNHLFNDWRGYHRLYLAATSLEFTHPQSGQPMIINAPLQNDFHQTLSALNLASAVPEPSQPQ